MQVAHHLSLVFTLVLIVTVLPLPLVNGEVVGNYGTGNLGLLSTSTEATIFSSNVLLSTDDSTYSHHVEVSMAISDNGTIFAGWKNSPTHNGPGVRVSVVKSVDGGNTWTTPFDMPMFTSGRTGQSDPWLVWHDGSIYYAYLEYSITGPPLSQMTVAKSDDYGVSWTPVTASYGEQFADKETMVISDNGTIYLVYDDTDDATLIGNAVIRLTRSIDGGSTFQEMFNLTERSPWNGLPYITLSSENHLYVVWLYIEPVIGNWGNLVLSRSLDGGNTFDESHFINNDGNYSTTTPGKITLPVIRFDQNDRLYVLWADGFDEGQNSFDVYLRYSDDFGETWSERIRVNPTVQGKQWNPEMSIGTDGRLHIVYYDEQGAYYKPYYRTLMFTGDEGDVPEFSDPIPVADSETSSSFTRPGEYLSVQLDSDGIPHVAWSDGRNNEMDIYYAHLITAATTSPPPLALAAITGSVVLAIAVILIYAKRRRSMAL
ncbi:MAG: sialidase family protein [Candidatus Thorarchaeota archaeon]|jgi:hypothetical protein